MISDITAILKDSNFIQADRLELLGNLSELLDYTSSEGNTLSSEFKIRYSFVNLVSIHGEEHFISSYNNLRDIAKEDILEYLQFLQEVQSLILSWYRKLDLTAIQVFITLLTLPLVEDGAIQVQNIKLQDKYTARLTQIEMQETQVTQGDLTSLFLYSHLLWNALLYSEHIDTAYIEQILPKPQVTDIKSFIIKGSDLPLQYKGTIGERGRITYKDVYEFAVWHASHCTVFLMGDSKGNLYICQYNKGRENYYITLLYSKDENEEDSLPEKLELVNLLHIICR